MAWTTITTPGRRSQHRPTLRWPDGKQLALCVIVLLEHYEWEPPGSYGLRRPSGGISRCPHRTTCASPTASTAIASACSESSTALDANGVPANVAMDALTAEHYGWLGRHCVQQGCELLGHGVAASRLITSRMSEAERRAPPSPAPSRPWPG